MVASGWPSVILSRMACDLNAGLKTAVSTALGHTSMRLSRHLLRFNSSCTQQTFQVAEFVDTPSDKTNEVVWMPPPSKQKSLGQYSRVALLWSHSIVKQTPKVMPKAMPNTAECRNEKCSCFVNLAVEARTFIALEGTKVRSAMRVQYLMMFHMGSTSPLHVYLGMYSGMWV